MHPLALVRPGAGSVHVSKSASGQPASFRTPRRKPVSPSAGAWPNCSKKKLADFTAAMDTAYLAAAVTFEGAEESEDGEDFGVDGED